MLKRNRIRLAQAKQAVAAYERIPLRFVDVDLDHALELADQFGVYAYDAYLIACAIRQQCALLTLDRGLTHAANQAGVKVLEIA